MLLQIFLLILGYVILIMGTNWFVNGSESIAKRYKVSEFLINHTIVVFRASDPELGVSEISSINGFSGVCLGNVYFSSCCDSQNRYYIN